EVTQGNRSCGRLNFTGSSRRHNLSGSFGRLSERHPDLRGAARLAEGNAILYLSAAPVARVFHSIKASSSKGKGARVEDECQGASDFRLGRWYEHKPTRTYCRVPWAGQPQDARHRRVRRTA